MTKAISLENLQEFKNKCDQTYAPIGGGGNEVVFYKTTSASNITTTGISVINTPEGTQNKELSGTFHFYIVPRNNTNNLLSLTVSYPFHTDQLVFLNEIVGEYKYDGEYYRYKISPNNVFSPRWFILTWIDSFPSTISVNVTTTFIGNILS